MTWSRGAEDIERLLRDNELEVVEPSDELARRLLDDADNHLVSARAIGASDRNGAYQLAYDAARKACASLLAPQGLRATTKGGHIAIQDTVVAQFGGQGGLLAFAAFSRLAGPSRT